MGEDTHEPRDRLKAYLRSEYHDGLAIKRLSRAIPCTMKAAENMLEGHWPNSRHWQRLVQIFGRDVLDAVFGPDINATVARLKREEAHLERQLLETRARRTAVEGPPASVPQRPATAAADVVDIGEARAFAPGARGRR